eukprot:7047591-Pyramimonas_sp.AAC.1
MLKLKLKLQTGPSRRKGKRKPRRNQSGAPPSGLGRRKGQTPSDAPPPTEARTYLHAECNCPPRPALPKT